MEQLLTVPELQNKPIQIDLYYGGWDEPPRAYFTACSRLMSFTENGKVEAFNQSQFSRWHFTDIKQAVEGAKIIQDIATENRTPLPYRLICLATNMRYMQVGAFPDI